MRPMDMPLPMVAMETSKDMGGVLMPHGAQTVVTGYRIGYYRPLGDVSHHACKALMRRRSP